MEQENIRNPDPVITDQLIDTHQPDEYELAIQESINSYNNYLKQQENDLKKLIEMEKQARLARFDKIKKYCIRMVAIDIENRSVYEIFLNYISLYESEYIDHVLVDEDFYYRFFKLITSSRLTKDDIDNCKQFIQI